MPGNVQPINSPSLDPFPPVGLRFSKYTVVVRRHALQAQYLDGSVQVWSDVATSRRKWQVEFRPRACFVDPETQSQLDALRNFYNAHIGLPFLFADLHSGQRIAAVFSSAWVETSGPSRYTVSLEIEEVY
jgi:hypothetical protein